MGGACPNRSMGFDMLRVLDLFSGIGGFSLGLERTGGFRTVAFCEIDEFCRAVLAKHWPGVPIHEDIKELTTDAVGPVDIVTGGFPCQPWSVAGKRGGTGDDRDLWPEMRRVVAAVQPRWVLGENVPGLDDAKFMGLDRVLSDLEGLGYSTVPIEIPACAVDAPHRRARIWIVGFLALPEPKSRVEAARVECATRQSLAGRSGENVAHRYGTREPQQGGGIGNQRGRPINGGESPLADSDQQRRQQDTRGAPGDEEAHGRAGRHGGEQDGDHVVAGDGEGAMEHAAKPRRRRTGSASKAVSQLGTQQRFTGRNSSIWTDCETINGRRVKPGVRLLAHGIPNRVSKLRALGNSIVPQIVEQIGYAILEAEEMTP